MEEFKDIDELRTWLIEQAKLQATPIDYEQLQADGFIKKKGAWWEVLVPIAALPEHVQAQVKEIMIETKTTEQGKGSKSFVKLPKSWKKAQQLYRSLSGKNIKE